MCMHWLEYIWLKRNERLKNVHGTTFEVAMIADVSEPTVDCVHQCVTGPL